MVIASLMAGFSQQDCDNLSDFLQNYVDEEIVIRVAKTVSKNAVPICSQKEAVDIIFLHGIDLRTILNKRSITREMLFRFLHQNQVSVQPGFTKQSLIDNVIDFWSQRNTSSVANGIEERSTRTTAVSDSDNAENFPINLMARQFTKWFFDRCNANELTTADLWPDANIQLTMYFEDGVDERNASTSREVVDTLNSVRNEYQLYFNASTLHRGCQGRIDIHGLVLVLSCGTLHTPGLCVGVFETVFKLMQDPFTDNNWKIKSINFILRSKGDATTSTSLEESEAMSTLLALPAPSDDI